MALHDGWLVGQLLGQIRTLLDRLDAGQALPAEVRTTLANLTTLASKAEPLPPSPVKALPWLLRVEQVLLGDWQAVTDGQVRCPACGSDQVGRKSATPRLKKYYNELHTVCEVAVYRYYCRNAQCALGHFTPAAGSAALLPLPHGGPPAGGADVCVGLRDLPAHGHGFGRGQPDRLALGERLGR